jgi:hypothetical protein
MIALLAALVLVSPAAAFVARKWWTGPVLVCLPTLSYSRN